MESLFIKIVLSGTLLVYLFLYYEEIWEFYQLQTYGEDDWQKVSQMANCSCDGGKTRNCYPHATDKTLCGKCFETCRDSSLNEYSEEIKNELVFALAASQKDVNKLLVLIASIHRNYPKTKILIFDKENTTFLENQLISIRNTKVIRIVSKGNVENGILTPFYLTYAINNFSTVFWLTVDLEFHNSKLTQSRGFEKASKLPIVFISRDSSHKTSLSGYRQFFPSSYVLANFPLAAVFNRDSKSLIKWAERCALSPECWKCETSSGLSEDCTWNVLYQIATNNKQIRLIDDFSNSLQKQSWSPPECDFYCTLYFITITFVVVLAVGALALLLLKNATKKKL